MQIRKLFPVLIPLGFVMLLGSQVRSAEPPSVKATMQYKPVHFNDVEIETPAPNAFNMCKVTVVREAKMTGWVVAGPTGQTIRRFMDTNGDNVVDQWSYFRNGLEVYRDIDSNANNKVDQSRWLNTAGTRWGIDANEDGRIDTWKMISAEEVSRVAVRALVGQDATLLTPLLITKDDLRSLGIKGEMAEKLLEAVSEPAAKLRKNATGSKILTPKTAWMRFDSSTPSVIPADQLKTSADLIVYENVMAIVETGSTTPGLVQIGELVRIGDVWKLTSLPQPMDGPVQIAEAGLIMTPPLPAQQAAVPPAPNVSPDLQKLVEKLMELDKRTPPPTAGRADVIKYNQDRAELLAQLRAESKTVEDRSLWTRQLADGITAAVQIGAFPSGVERLRKLETDVKEKEPAKSKLIPFVTYRRMVGEYTVEMEKAETNADREKIQGQWLKQLETFATESPQAEDAPDAMLQIAIAQEFQGKKEATVWFEKIVADHAGSPAAERATGALTRLGLVGKTLSLSGNALEGTGKVDAKASRGKMLLVLFWASWCKPCTQDLPQIKDLYETYKPLGFDVVGVNLDTIPAPAKDYIEQQGVPPWPQIHEPGGLESAPARGFGIISLPTMFIVDQDGKVLNRSASVADLKTALGEALKKK